MLPPLLRVPSIHQDQNLNVRANAQGLLVLKSSKFKSRYVGSKSSAVDINGKFWLSAADLKKSIAGDSDKGKKKGPGKNTRSVNNLSRNVDTKINDLSTIQAIPGADLIEFSTIEPELLTEKKPREYRVKKSAVRQRILTYIRTEKGKKELYFWTVTFPEGTSDDIAYQAYNIWLTSLRKYKMLKEYLWIAERQKNGTVHFHIAIPHKMNVQRANAMLAGTLKGFAKKKLIPFTVAQCKRYNGVDIAKNRNTKRVTNFAIKKGSRSLSNYLTKYITKNDSPFPHLAWHNSRGFSSMFTGITFTEFEAFDLGFWAMVNEFGGFETEFFAFYPWANRLPNGSPPSLLLLHLDIVNNYSQTLN